MSTRRNRTRVLTAGAVTAAVALAGAGYGIASAAEDPPALAFRAATHDVTVTRYVDEGSVWMDFDLGVNLIAGKQPFEIRAKRKNYAQPIVATQEVTDAKGKKTSVAVPDGLFTSFNGFEKFTSISIKDAAGATVKEYDTDWCPNTWNSLRTRPDAPSSTPYPQYCAGGNPFILGSVWGVQAGYNAPVESTPRVDIEAGEPEFDLPAGKYQVTVKLNEKYRSWLAVPADSATVALNVTVQDQVFDRGRAPEGALRAKAAMKAAAVGDELPPGQTAVRGEHSDHAGQGDASVQVSAYDPAFRPPAKVPATLAAKPKSGPKPDLRSLPAWGIELSQEDGKTYVNFGATVWNAGTSPLVVDGFRRTGTDLMDAYQYFFDKNGKEVGSVAAGTMEWDPREGHMHWHFTDFAQYNLLNSDQSLAVRSGKEAFCLANTDAVDYTIANAKWRPENTDLATSCGANTAVAVREVLDIGNGDTYSQARPGQSFEITDLPNGTYYIQTLANPANKLAETKTDNNASLRKIVLGGTPEKRTLEVPPVNGIKG
ncbi:lysyl oxidase family protein [Actinoplanes sp. NPDC049265]|uniref:lysyl oxidase family protein n=1 Tax=Actinoplanes sp. NPDC049265 TaxID=3363902 RepID=UPI00371EB792